MKLLTLKTWVKTAFQYILGGGILVGGIALANQCRREGVDSHRAIKATWDHNGAVSPVFKNDKLKALPDVCADFNTAYSVGLGGKEKYIVCLHEDLTKEPKVIPQNI